MVTSEADLPLLLTAALAVTLAGIVQADTHLASDTLGVSYEFKLHVDAGREECFYQYVEQNASVYVAFQVSRSCARYVAYRRFLSDELS